MAGGDGPSTTTGDALTGGDTVLREGTLTPIVPLYVMNTGGNWAQRLEARGLTYRRMRLLTSTYWWPFDSETGYDRSAEIDQGFAETRLSTLIGAGEDGTVMCCDVEYPSPSNTAIAYPNITNSTAAVAATFANSPVFHYGWAPPSQNTIWNGTSTQFYYTPVNYWSNGQMVHSAWTQYLDLFQTYYDHFGSTVDALGPSCYVRSNMTTWLDFMSGMFAAIEQIAPTKAIWPWVSARRYVSGGSQALTQAELSVMGQRLRELALAEKIGAVFLFEEGGDPYPGNKELDAVISQLLTVDNSPPQAPATALAPGQTLNTDTGTLNLTLDRPCRINVGALDLASSDGTALVVTVTGQGETTTFEETWDKDNYDNLAANQAQIENRYTTDTLQAGTHSITATVDGAAARQTIATRAHDSVGFPMQLGCNFHSGPWCINDGGRWLIAGSTPGDNRRFVGYKDDAASFVEVLTDAAKQTQERYHSSTAIVKAGGSYVVVGCDHNSRVYVDSATSLAGLAGGTGTSPHAITCTYTNIAAGSTGVYAVHRDTTEDVLFMWRMDDPSAPAADFIDFLNDESTAGRCYPIQLEMHQTDAGGDLLLLSWQNRAVDQWAQPLFVSVFDPSVGDRGQWYNILGDTIGATTTGDTRVSKRWPAAHFNAYDAGTPGMLLVADNASFYRYTQGPIAMRVAEWGAGGKEVQVAAVWCEMDDGATDSNTKASCKWGITTTQASGQVTSFDTGGDAFSLDGSATNGYRGPSTCWLDGDDLWIALCDRNGRDRAYGYSVLKTNMYYDMGGHLLKIYRVQDVFTHATEAALTGAVELMASYTV